MEHGRTTLVLAGLMLASAAALFAEVKEFEITASKFKFKPSTIEVNEGDQVRLTLRSTDTRHGLAIEAFKVDVKIPKTGEPATAEFVASKAGWFPFACSQFCGSGHPDMKGMLGVRPRDGSPLPPPPAPVNEDLDQGDPSGFTMVSLPTTQRTMRGKLVYRITHRFGTPLGQGDFGDLVGRLFGFDSGAQIGMELRYGLRGGTQVGVYRTSDRTIELFAQQDLLRQRSGHPASAALRVSVEGLDNFQEEYSPSVGLLVARDLGWASVQAGLSFVGNTSGAAGQASTEDNTLVGGLGARVRIMEGLSLVGEWAPRLAGFRPGSDHLAFAIEKQVGGHDFQINVSNGLGTTTGQVARGGFTYDDWYLGFNISRKFY